VAPLAAVSPPHPGLEHFIHKRDDERSAEQKTAVQVEERDGVQGCELFAMSGDHDRADHQTKDELVKQKRQDSHATTKKAVALSSTTAHATYHR
jgi:hypothetical protein